MSDFALCAVKHLQQYKTMAVSAETDWQVLGYIL